MSERTLILIKPDGVQRQLVGRIIERYEQRGLRIVGLKLLQVDRALAERHYAVHADKPFFPGLVAFITSSPLVAMAVEGTNAVAVCRAINGATRPHEAAPGSIRGDFALETGMNLVHASDSPENAAAELALWFDAVRAARLPARRGRLDRRGLRPRPRCRSRRHSTLVTDGPSETGPLSPRRGRVRCDTLRRPEAVASARHAQGSPRSRPLP